jgi:sulfatase maturation enzyme AslB (radical SAM superfamily)
MVNKKKILKNSKEHFHSFKSEIDSKNKILNSNCNNWKYLDGDLLLTMACPVECEFCIYGCNPKGEWMPKKTIEKVAKEYTKNKMGIRICGGEPFYNFNRLAECLDIVLKYQKPYEVLIITSGFFGNDVTKTKKALKILTSRKLDTLVVSADRFHNEKIKFLHLINIIVEAKKQGLKLIFRVSSDEKSYDYLDKLAEIIIKYGGFYEANHDYAFLGNAETLERNLTNNKDKRREYFKDKIIYFAKKYGESIKISDYAKHSPKRSQRKFAGKFHATTFPNGDVYGDTQTTQGTYMGNINDEALKSIIDRFSKTLPGYILWSEKSNCDRMKKFLPKNVDDQCDYCRNTSLFVDLPNEAIGRKHVVISSSDNFDKIIEKYICFNKELLLTFILEEKNLNKEYGVVVKRFLGDLKVKNIRFRLSRPLPKCLFGADYGVIVKEFDVPIGCYDCKELFYVENLKVKSCNILSKEFTTLEYAKSRNEIWEFFNVLRLEKKLNETCKKCLYLKRKQCDGLCYRV